MESDGVIVLKEQKITRDWSWIDNRWTVIQGDNRMEFCPSHRLYSGTELRAVLLQCGFARVDIYGSLAGTPYDHNAKRLIAVARKG